MAVLTQLRNDAAYRPCDWDLKADAAGRAYWLEHFREHVDLLLPLIAAEHPRASVAERAAFRAEYLAIFDHVAAHPDAYPRIDILLFDELRAELLARYGYRDPFRGVKARENEAALALLPGVLAEIDAAAPAAQRELLAAGLMAGNIFDLGSRATIERYRDGRTAFATTRATQPRRPWAVDDVDAWWRRRDAGPTYAHVLFFVDNAGSDIVLGGLPFVRWLLAAGSAVTLAANSGPALNDVTAEELGPLLERAAALDATLAEGWRSGRLRVAATGNAAPLIDLTRLAAEFVAAARTADLLVLHGMGRAVESNWRAEFDCDVLRTAVLKDARVAERLGARLFDCVWRYTPRR